MGPPNGKTRILLPVLVTVVSLYILISGVGNLHLLQQYSPLLGGKGKSNATSSLESTSSSNLHSSFLDSVCRPGTKSSSSTLSSCIKSYSEGLSRLVSSYRPHSPSQQPANKDDDRRRLTGVAVWNNDGFKEHLRQFLYSAQLNEDVFDLLFINRKTTKDAECVDFERHNITIKPGGNVRVICMSNEEWWRRHADFLCSTENGWGCNIRQYQSVYQALLQREDVANMEYKPFRGYVVHDLFLHPNDNPYWAWLDTDLSLGRLTHFPFNLLKPVSALLAVQQDYMYMGGQFTSFNKNDKALATEWKRIPEMRSVDAFLSSSMAWQEEGWWSRNLLRSDEGSYGDALSWVALPNVHGYDHELKGTETNTSFLISGRDVLEVDPTMSRLAMEGALLISRTEPVVDDLDSTGWNNILNMSAAADQQENLPLKEELSLADSTHDFVQFRKGDQCGTNFWYGVQNAQCIPHHPLETTWPPMMRASYVHLKSFPPGSIHRILVPDNTPRGYNRKQFSHYFITKNTLELPPFHIDDTMAMLINQDRVEVFQMGSDREKTFYRRRKDKTGSIG